MASFRLINTVFVGAVKHLPGSLVDDTITATAPLVAAGGLLWDNAATGIEAAVLLAIRRQRNAGINEAEMQAIMQNAVLVALV